MRLAANEAKAFSSITVTSSTTAAAAASFMCRPSFERLYI